MSTVNPASLGARSIIVVDDQTGAVLYAREPHLRLPPASITKIVTAVLALEHGPLDRAVRVSVQWDELKDSTRMGLFRGDVLTLEALLYGLLLPSGNDAAVAIAQEIGITEARFATLMTQKTVDLGLRDSQFKNPHGLDAEGHVTSVFDITHMARYAMRNPTFAEIAKTRETAVRGRYLYPMTNLNRIIWAYNGGDGVKNGYTDNALQTEVASATRNGRRVFVGAMHTNNYFSDCATLLDWAFDDDRQPIADDERAAPPSGLKALPDRWETAKTGPITEPWDGFDSWN